MLCMSILDSASKIVKVYNSNTDIKHAHTNTQRERERLNILIYIWVLQGKHFLREIRQNELKVFYEEFSVQHLNLNLGYVHDMFIV